VSHTFFITDVFAEASYAGNQLATLLDADDIDTSDMQKIAREFNFAETTFVTGGSLETGFDVRIFTPTRELPFAGHPTLGTAFLIRNEILKAEISDLTLNLGVGNIPVSFSDDGVPWMKQKPPTFGSTVAKERIADELGLQTSDIDRQFPVLPVSTGLEFLMVPVNSYEALKAARVIDGKLADGYFIFCQGGYNDEQSIQARMFASALGVAEDPATGSANGCLAGYLLEYEYFGSHDVEVIVGQGYEIDRPSQIYLKASKREAVFDIRVGGKVRVVAKGQWRSPR